MAQVQIIARHTITPGHEDEVFSLLPGFIDACRAEPGNLAYDIYRKVGDDRSYVLLERYASREALADHRASPHFTGPFLTQVVPLLDTRVIEEYDVPDLSPDRLPGRTGSRPGTLGSGPGHRHDMRPGCIAQR